MQLSASRRLRRIQGFEQLDVRGDHNRSVPVFGSQPKPITKIFRIIRLPIVKRAMMLQNVFGAQNLAVLLGILLDDGGIGDGAYDPVHGLWLRAGMVKREPKQTPRFSATRRSSQREYARLLRRSRQAIIKQRATYLVHPCARRIKRLKVLFHPIPEHFQGFPFDTLSASIAHERFRAKKIGVDEAAENHARHKRRAERPAFIVRGDDAESRRIGTR